MADDVDLLNVVVTGHGIEVEGAVFPSIDAFETSLEKVSRTRPVVIGVDSAAEIETFTRAFIMLKSLGFEQVSAAGEQDPTWWLYPPMPNPEVPDRVELSSEEPIVGENDS